MKTILIIDDEALILESVSDILEDEHYRVVTAANAAAAETILQHQRPDLILLDIWMPDVDGITLLRRWQEQGRMSCPIVMMSGHGTIETAVEATKLGAYDFLEKPLSSAKLLLTVERALHAFELKEQNQKLKAQIDPPRQIIGHSELMQGLRKHAEALARQKIPLLITGEGGSGKEHLAHCIHQLRQSTGSFVRANFAVMDESEALPALLGTSKRLGFIAHAQQGTLYINEVSLLPEEMQQALLNLIEDGEYYSEGRKQKSHIHFIFGSRLPKTLLKNKLLPRFYDCITIAHIEVPPLNHHAEDIPELLDYLSQQLADQEQLPYRHFSLSAQNYLRQHPWKGNIRELKNLVQRLLIASDENEIDLDEAKSALIPEQNAHQDDLWAQIIPQDITFRDAREMFEHQYLLAQFKRCDGNIAKLSQMVGMDRTNLYRKLRSVGIDPTLKPES